MILACDPGLATFGWAIVAPRTGRVHSLGVLLSESDAELDDSTDRARRAAGQALRLRNLVYGSSASPGRPQPRCTAIAAEAMSFGGAPNARFAMAISLGLSWGVIAGLATALGVELVEIPPKRWQYAVVPEAGGKIDYAVIEAKLASFVTGAAATQLAAIKPRHRNHALDACGIGVFAALQLEQTTRIVAAVGS